METTPYLPDLMGSLVTGLSKGQVAVQVLGLGVWSKLPTVTATRTLSRISALDHDPKP